MAHSCTWYMTNMPNELIDIVEKDVQQFDNNVNSSLLMGEELDTQIRDSKNAWISSSHWIGGLLWYYIDKMNRENFRYDITDIDGGTIQYTQYGPGQYYTWHKDQEIESFYKPQIDPRINVNLRDDLTTLEGEYVRKLSFVVQLSDPTEYTGGELQFVDNSNKTFFAPKQRGTVIVFDSRLNHRVRKIKTGLRKSLVGWVMGPRWR